MPSAFSPKETMFLADDRSEDTETIRRSFLKSGCHNTIVHFENGDDSLSCLFANTFDASDSSQYFHFSEIILFILWDLNMSDTAPPKNSSRKLSPTLDSKNSRHRSCYFIGQTRHRILLQ